MKNEQLWKPTKYVLKKGNLKSTSDTKYVSRSSRLMSDLVANFYATAIPEYAKGKLLDLGCGLAPLYGVYKNLTTEIVCSDWSNNMSHSAHIDVEQDLNQPLCFSDSSFDTVLLSDVLEHIYKPNNLLLEINRILDIDGVLLINVPFLYWIHERPYDYYRYTEFALKKMLEENNFEIIQFQPFGGAMEVLSDTSSKIMNQMPVIGRMYVALSYRLTSWFSHTKWGKHISQKSIKAFPLGYAVVAKRK